MIPLPVREKGDLVGYEWTRVDLIKLLQDIPNYNVFTEAEGYHFNTDEADKIINFIIYECVFPEGSLTGKPFVPERWQWAVFLNMYCWYVDDKPGTRRFNEVLIYLPRKNGKLLDLNTELVTPDGNVKMGEVLVGQTLFDAYGSPCKVTHVHPIEKFPKSYEVIFSNGETVKACADHQWFVRSRAQHPKYNNKHISANRKKGEKTTTNLVGNDVYEDVWTTQEMFDKGVDCSYGKTFFVTMHNGLQTEKADLPVDPYLLGYWLGDGSSTGPYLFASKEDAFRWPGEKVKQRTCYRVHVPALGGSVLRELGVKGNKHIPENYLRASFSQRLFLLQGLMDSDGTIGKRGTDPSFVNINKNIIDGVEQLVASLGLKYTTKQISKRSQNGTEGVYYQVQFMAYRDTHPVFRLDRKLSRQRLSTDTPSSRSRTCQIVSITPCNPVPMRCITVDSPTGTYLFGKTMLPTHNTSAFGAIPALISLFVDPEKRSQNFCCAADTEQAALNFRHAAYMVEQNPRLLNRLANERVRHGTKFMESKAGRTLKVLSSIADTKHGLSPNYVGVDEVHAHHSSELIDVMVTGTAARDSPLIVYTTTADYDRPSVCNQLHKRGTLLCKGLQSDPNFLPVIYEALPTDDWEDPAVWRKANPNFGISIKERWFNTELNRVRNNPANLNRFLRLHLNIRTSVETTWIPPHIWNSTNPVYDSSERLTVPEIREKMEQFPDWFPIVTDPKWEFSSINILLNSHLDYYTWFFRKVEELKDEPYFAGYDHTAVSDIASLCLFFPEQRTMLSFNWVPADSIERRSIEEQIPYSNWNLCGLISHSPGGTIDEDQIISAMIGDKGVGILTHFGGCRKVAFDNWGSTNISKQIERYGYECIGYPQSFAGMNQPCKTTEALMEQKNLFHGGHPVLQWMNTKIMVVENNNGAVRPDKKNSTDKIDGIVAYLTALGAWMYDEETVLSSIPGLVTKQDLE